MAKRIIQNLGDDGIDRRGFLECMAWAGTGLLWTINGGVAHNQIAHRATEVPLGTLNFVQISDSHMGFNKAANPDVAATLQQAVAKINALPTPPLFVIHTGDISHLSKPSSLRFLGTGVPLSADVTLASEIAMAMTLVIGMMLARRRRYHSHAWCQGTVVALNLIVIAQVIAPAFRSQVAPKIPARLARPTMQWLPPTR